MTRKNLFIIMVVIAACIIGSSYKSSFKKLFFKKIEPQRHTTDCVLQSSGAFNSLLQERMLTDLAIEGSIPSWVNGTLYLTGPAIFDLGNTTLKYWFNGLAMIHAFTIGQKPAYKNAFLKGKFYNRCIRQGKFDKGFTTKAKKPSFFGKFGNMLKSQEPYDNANLAVWKINKQLCALTEVPSPVVFDGMNLKTYGLLSFDDEITAHMATAQPLFDAQQQCWYNIFTEFGTTSTYKICSINQQQQRKIIAEIATKVPSYVRSFGMTQHFIILIESPLVIHPMDLLTNPNAFIDNLRWEPGHGTNITVIDKRSGAVVRSFKAEPCFMFNVINAYENNDDVCLDVALYKNAKILKKTQIPLLRSDLQHAAEPVFYHRFTLNIKNGSIVNSSYDQTTIEFPEINKQYAGKEYLYCYGLSSATKTAFPHQIIKLNVATGDFLLWEQAGCLPNKPIFIAKPGQQKEDEGIIAAIIYDNTTQTSFLLLLDASNFDQLARIKLPHHIPMGVNGIFDFNQ